jgi:hypothetical protein
MRDDGDGYITFKLAKRAYGELKLGKLNAPIEDGVAVIPKKSLEDGLLRPEFTVGKTLLRAAPLLVERGKIIPTEAGAEAVMALSEKYDELQESYKKLLEKCDFLEERIATAKTFSLT